MNIAILKFGMQGQSAYDYWRDGNTITIHDANPVPNAPEGVSVIHGDHYLENLDRYDLLVRSPSVHPDDIVRANSPEILQKVTTNTNEFFRVCPTKNIIGVTGTKGKGTTTTFIAKILEADGKRVHVGGNIGIPPLDLLKNDIQPEDYVVLELANFQLIDLQVSPPIAVCLTVSPEHLDWHKDTAEYIRAKQQLFAHQSDSDAAVFFAASDYAKEVASVSPGQKIPYFAAPGAHIENDTIIIDGIAICKTNEIKILGRHNWENICAAVTAVWQVTKDIDAMRSVITTLRGLPYRLELVREHDGVAYYNDSFSTTTLATVAAIEAFTQPKVLIIGGYDRGLDLDELAGSIVKNSATIRKILLIGASRERIATALDAQQFSAYEVTEAQTMREIVALAKEAAQPGDAVVFSPGFASFDMFKNFEDRGDQFRDAVQLL